MCRCKAGTQQLSTSLINAQAILCEQCLNPPHAWQDPCLEACPKCTLGDRCADCNAGVDLSLFSVGTQVYREAAQVFFQAKYIPFPRQLHGVPCVAMSGVPERSPGLGVAGVSKLWFDVGGGRRVLPYLGWLGTTMDQNQSASEVGPTSASYVTWRRRR
jgi:hypothetical protein